MITADGSHTIRLPEQNITYHSHYGAIQESLHVFIQAGLHEVIRRKKALNIFELGFGTGLNALLSMAESERHQLQLNYHGLEAFPLEIAMVEALNYETLLPGLPVKDWLKTLHTSPAGETVHLSKHVTFTRTQALWQAFESKETFDLVYMDAFAPEIQPELWTEEVFIKMNGMMQPGACLVTYCSKGSVRRAMKAAGLTVTKIPGPPGKREMVRAFKG